MKIVFYQLTMAFIPPRARREVVLKNCDYFTAVQLWPLKDRLNPDGWLANFRGDEIELAVHLLNRFTFFARPLIDSIFASGFTALSRRVSDRGESIERYRMRWREFIDSVLIVYVPGEEPNASDSGFSFARKARQVLGLPEKQIGHPADARAGIQSDGFRLVFVDDFVGTGEQFIRMWQTQGFAEQHRKKPFEYYYCPAFCTEAGRRRLERECAGLVPFGIIGGAGTVAGGQGRDVRATREAGGLGDRAH
jgi:hypothetical protein